MKTRKQENIKAKEQESKRTKARSKKQAVSSKKVASIKKQVVNRQKSEEERNKGIKELRNKGEKKEIEKEKGEKKQAARSQKSEVISHKVEERRQKSEKEVGEKKQVVSGQKSAVSGPIDKGESKEIEVEAEAKKVHPPTENAPDETLARKTLKNMLLDSGLVRRTTLKKPKKEAKSMEELFEVTGYKLQGLKIGQEAVATVTDKNKRSVFFDVGAKTEGTLIEKEIEFISDYLDYLRVGDTVRVVVVSPETERGQVLLSLSKSATEWRWRLFETYQELDMPIDVRGLDINRGGMIARVLNVRGFIPVSQFGRQWIGKLNELYNKVFAVKIIEVNREKNRLIFSEKAVSESAMLNQQQSFLDSVAVGDVYEAQVSGVMPFGIFVRVLMRKSAEEPDGGAFLDGLVHISEISWEKVTDIQSLFKLGDEVKVQVLEIDKSNHKLNLSMKRLLKDPWDEIAKKLPVESKAKGKITRLAAYGAFVEIDKGIEGLIHISKIPSDFEIKVGQKVEVYIESITPANHRISLGIVLTGKPVGYK